MYRISEIFHCRPFVRAFALNIKPKSRLTRIRLTIIIYSAAAAAAAVLLGICAMSVRRTESDG